LAIARFNLTRDISIFGKKIALTIKIAEAGHKRLKTLAGQKKLRLEVLSSLNFMKQAGDKTRTCDRLITNQLLYQLSYTSSKN
jgi:hypothetical protein